MVESTDPLKLNKIRVLKTIMTTRKKSTLDIEETTSDKRPYMSEYDKNVEVRLQELESKLNSINSESVDFDRLYALEQKVDGLISKLSKKMSLD